CGPRSGRSALAHTAAEVFALPQCRAGGSDGIGRGIAPDQRIRCPHMSLVSRTATSPNGPSPLPDEPTVAKRKEEARLWFESLRDRICAEFEKIEGELLGTHREMPAGKLERKAWRREAGANGEDRGGGIMAVMRGRVFEKVGVNVSTVF